MRIGLFIPCYIDQFFPNVGLATVDVLEMVGVEVDYPEEQSCCGQPMANTGCVADAFPLAKRFYDSFRDYDYVVCPSGSCTAMVRKHYHSFQQDLPGLHDLCQKTFELCEFLHDVRNITTWKGAFPHRVGLHNSCHGLRELRLASSSEIVAPEQGKVRGLLASLEGIELTELQRPDECCGFGGTFAVSEEAISCRMGNDRIADHQQARSEIIAAVDMSCLMHLNGLIRRQQLPLKTMHIAEILVASRK